MAWTQKQKQNYHRQLDNGRLKAVRLGNRLAKQIARKVGEGDKDNDDPKLDKIPDIFEPLILEPILSGLDDAYDLLGDSNFLWVIDLYVGRKCAKIIPLLLEIAKRLYEGKHDKKNKAEGGGPDCYMWVDFYSDTSIYSKRSIWMRWDTQSKSYYIELSGEYDSLDVWKLYVAEYDKGERRRKAENKWEKEPGFVLEYKSQGKVADHLSEDFHIDNQKVENAWLRLGPIARFLSLVNPSCTALDINLYDPPFAKRRRHKVKQKEE